MSFANRIEKNPKLVWTARGIDWYKIWRLNSTILSLSGKVGLHSSRGCIISKSFFDWGCISFWMGWGSIQEWGCIQADTVSWIVNSKVLKLTYFGLDFTSVIYGTWKEYIISLFFLDKVVILSKPCETVENLGHNCTFTTEILW